MTLLDDLDSRGMEFDINFLLNVRGSISEIKAKGMNTEVVYADINEYKGDVDLFLASKGCKGIEFPIIRLINGIDSVDDLKVSTIFIPNSDYLRQIGLLNKLKK